MNVIVIPAYEPDENLVCLTRGLVEKGYCVVVTDDGSGESYRPVFEQIWENAIVLTHQKNMGKGQAIRTALRYIKDHIPEAQTIAVADADGQHDIADVEHVMAVASVNKDSLVLGARSFGADIPKASRVGNLITRKIFQLLSGIRVSDTQTGLRAFSGKLAELFLTVQGDRYEYEMNVLCFCVKKRIPILEIPVKTIYHDKENSCSHFHKLRDSLRIYHQIIRFALSSGSSFMLDYILFGLLCFLFGEYRFGVLCSNVTARICSAVFNYQINARYVFHEQDNGRKTALSYFILALAILLCNNLVLTFYMKILLIGPMTAKIFTELTLFLVSFAVQNFWIFHHRREARA